MFFISEQMMQNFGVAMLILSVVVIFVAGFVIPLLFVVWLLRYVKKRNYPKPVTVHAYITKKYQGEYFKNDISKYYNEFDLEFMEKYAGTEVFRTEVGPSKTIKKGSTKIVRYVTFTETETGDRLRLRVKDEATYDHMREGDTGTLTYQANRYKAFEKELQYT